MRIEDRVREGLRRSARGVEDEATPEHLWQGIERGLNRARRREGAARLAAAALALLIGAGAVAWLAFAFAGSGRKPVTGAPALSVRDVRVFGVPDGGAKIYGRVSNRSTRALGAEIRCTVLDASGNVLGTATASVPYVHPGASPPFGPLGGQFHGAPSSARCTARPIVAVSPSPSPVAPSVFQPGFVAFWDSRHGIAAGLFGDPSCYPTCAGMVQITEDGGRSWHLSLRGDDHIYDVAVSGSSDAWVLAGPCAMGTCDIRVLFSGDGGRTWSKRSTGDLKQVSFGSAKDGWGVGNAFSIGSQQLEWTADGGRTWQSRAVPCPREAPTATDVSFVSAHRGWLLCTGEGSAGNEGRAILETADGGGTWSTVAEATAGPSSSGLTTSGYPTGIFFLPDGHGWMWAERGVGIEATTDGGRSWRVAGTVPNGADTSMRSAWFLSDTAGFAVLMNGNAQASQLIETLDGGRTWHVIHAWPF